MTRWKRVILPLAMVNGSKSFEFLPILGSIWMIEFLEACTKPQLCDSWLSLLRRKAIYREKKDKRRWEKKLNRGNVDTNKSCSGLAPGVLIMILAIRIAMVIAQTVSSWTCWKEGSFKTNRLRECCLCYAASCRFSRGTRSKEVCPLFFRWKITPSGSDQKSFITLSGQTVSCRVACDRWGLAAKRNPMENRRKCKEPNKEKQGNPRPSADVDPGRHGSPRGRMPFSVDIQIMQPGRSSMNGCNGDAWSR